MVTPTDQASIETPWSRGTGEVAAALGTDPSAGLTMAEVVSRREIHGPNLLEGAKATPEWRKFLTHFADPLIYLLMAAVSISLVVWLIEGREGVPFEALVITGIMLFNALLAYLQEARAERAMEALARMSAATNTVVRDGRSIQVDAVDLVPGDLLQLAEGDSVGADARLIEGSSLAVVESSLTGESQPVDKGTEELPARTALADRSNMLFKGTAVVRGRGTAVVTATGMATEMGSIARLLAKTEEPPSPLEREVARIGRVLGLAVILVSVVVVAAIFLTDDITTPGEVVSVLLVGVSLAVAAVPEGLPAILSVVLALGVQRMAGRNAIVKRLAAVEALGSVDVICSDKTGTLTKSEMTIVRVVTPTAEVEVTGSGFVPEGQFLIDGRPVADGRIMEEVESILRGGSLANDATLEESDGRWMVTGDPTEASFLVAEAKLGSAQARKTRFRRVGEIPFTSERRLMSTFEADHERGGRVALVTKGAPDILLSRCTHERVGDEESPLTEPRRRELSATVERLADEALRMLAVGYRIINGDGPVPEDPEAEEGLVYLGMVGIIDPARPEARDSVAEAREAGIRVMMITGDHPRTAARIAADLGIADHGAPVVTGDEVEGLDDAALKEVLTGTTVFARVAPEHKLRFVTTLQSDGSSVAMTGDGVNDAPALKAADIGVAMGVTGTEVAKEAADMVLADDDFTTIVAAVREGRGIFANVRKAIRFLLSSNTGEVITMFVGVVFAGFLGLDLAADGVAVPLLAPQILWINLLTDIAPALALGVDPTPADVMRVPPRRPGQGVFDARMWAGILWVGMVMAVVTLVAIDLRLPGGVFEASGSVQEGRTMAFTTLVVAQLFNCFNARSDRDTALGGLFVNPLLWGAIALSLALQIGVVHLSFLNRAFGTVPLSMGDWALCVGLASLVLWATEARKLGMRLLGR